MKTAVPLLLAAATSVLAQGPLMPPGLPAATMKSLDQIEARTAIPKSPAVPVAGPHYTISQPGSYYLTGNVEVASGNGINITASNVTLDLNGFALISKTVSPAAGYAINLAADLRSIEIKNGRITGGTVRTYTGPKPWNATFAGPGWIRGIQDVDASPATGVLLSYLTVEQCAANGIDLDGSSILQHITATSNGDTGIFASYGSVTNAAATSNGAYGISASNGSVANSTASSNGTYGISASNGSVTNATATSNGTYGIYASYGSVTNATAYGNGNVGIYAFSGSVTNSSAISNFKSGITVNAGVAAHCVANGNSTDPATADKQIDVSAGGQRDACVPASE
jgi:hypothetical protein